MIQYIIFRNNAYKQLKLNISVYAEFNDILKILNDIKLENSSFNIDHVIYAVLELINNSLRAHREKSLKESVFVYFKAENPEFTVTIKDSGRGFDPKILPFDFNSNSREIDLTSDDFQEYRKIHKYKRFGIGLYIAKRTFTSLELVFLDFNGNKALWKPGKIEGTCIILKINEDLNE